MINQTEELDISPIFTGLTRPPMMWGITVDYLFLCYLGSFGCFMVTSQPLFLVAYLPLHLFGFIVCKIDHNIFRIIVKLSECPNIRNKKIWECQSYEPF